MSEENFECITHIVPGQHIRQYARGTAERQEDELKLVVKQYKPRYTKSRNPTAVTIIGCHASGFPKELYEPVWDELFKRTKSDESFAIRNIWIADVVNQGASGVLNENTLGAEPSYFDHARDLLLMVNHFREEMPRPIVGIGHSLGGCVMLNLALLHPRLLTTVIAIEPVVNKTGVEMHFNFAYPITFKKDHWPTRKEAEELYLKHPFYKHWDPTTLSLFVKYGLRNSPTATLDSSETTTTLTTTKHQEVFSFGRPAYPKPGVPLSSFKPTRAEYPDLNIEEWRPNSVFYNPAPTQTFQQLQYLKPSCLYIYGSKTHMASSKPQGQTDKLEITGTGVGGSGGHADGKVDQHVFNGSHFVPFESPKEVSQVVQGWLQKELEVWSQEEEKEREIMSKIPVHERAMMDDDWRWWINNSFGKKKVGAKGTSKL